MSWRARVATSLLVSALASVAWGGTGRALDALHEHRQRERIDLQLRVAAAVAETARLKWHRARIAKREEEFRSRRRTTPEETAADHNRMHAEYGALIKTAAATEVAIRARYRPWAYKTAWERLSFLPLVIGMLAAIRMVLRHRRETRRSAAGRCVACGYDLRETPHRCPECGAVPL